MTNVKKHETNSLGRRPRILIFLFLFLVVFTFTGCEDIDHESKYIKDEVEEEEKIVYEGVAPLILIKEEQIEEVNVKQLIFYDPETLVMYSYFTRVDAEGLIEMHNSDGTLRIYDEESDVKVLTYISQNPVENMNSMKEYVFFDPETLVMYVHYSWISDKGLSEMHNSDGSLRTYNPNK